MHSFPLNSFIIVIYYLQGELLKKLRTIAWRFTVIKEEFYSVLLLHLLKPLFSVFHGLQALSIFLFVLVNDLYIGDPLEAN